MEGGGNEIGDAHDHDVDEVDGGSLGEFVVVVLHRHTIGDGAKLEPESAEWKPVPLEVPVRHDERREGLHHPDKPVPLHDQAPIDQAIRLGVTRFTEQDVSFGFFVGQNGGSGAVGEAADDGLLVGVRRAVDRDEQRLTR